MAPTWYAVHTNARKEGLVDRLLRHQVFETLYLYRPSPWSAAPRSAPVNGERVPFGPEGPARPLTVPLFVDFPNGCCCLAAESYKLAFFG